MRARADVSLLHQSANALLKVLVQDRFRFTSINHLHEIGYCMNTQLANSLAEAVSALSLEDFQVFQTALLSHIVKKTPGVAGGHACIRNTRIAVWTLISLSQQGMGEGELINNFPGLTPFDLLAAQVYYQTHHDEVDTLINSHHSEEGWE